MCSVWVFLSIPAYRVYGLYDSVDITSLPLTNMIVTNIFDLLIKVVFSHEYEV